ncbi:hypothetical protein CF15_04825 [Pyrodictium occultum]|uniref:Radical SAM core domain-containing protein n=2 Tax=Pyrodictium occultum TaxID=2309 RepID=A0A0V8RVM6_PYROC|nr:hypothetical protein CF15_04825 [Pyrodictium occultum]
MGEAVETAVGLGAASVSIIPAMPSGRAVETRSYISSRELLEALRGAEEAAERLGVTVSAWCAPFVEALPWAKHLRASNCRDWAVMDITPSGKVVLCDVLGVVVADAAKEGLRRAWEKLQSHPLNKLTHSVPRECRGCPLAPAAAGAATLGQCSAGAASRPRTRCAPSRRRRGGRGPGATVYSRPGGGATGRAAAAVPGGPERLREHGVVVKRCRGCLRVALVYPSVYSAAVASLAYQNLYYMINSLDYAVAERFVAASTAGEEPPPRSLETGSPLSSFDLILAPVSYELDYVTLARILLAAGIEPLRRRRGGRGPLVAVGGPVPSMNPAVALGLADLVLVGEAEETVPRLLDALHGGGPGGAEELACSTGFLAPGCSSPVHKAVVASLDEAFHTTIQFRVPGSGEPWGEAYMVEASRGCPHMCRFCMEAHFLLPARHRSTARIRSLVEEGVEANKVNGVAFYSLSFFDHPGADRLLEWVVGEGLEASIGSLRADQLTEDRVELMSRAGQRVVTVAPETLSPRLCRGIGKCIPLERVEEIAELAWRRRMHVKLYLMLGLPGESDGDVEAYAEALRRLSRRAPPAREAIRVSVNPLVPKPWTPLQRHPLIDRRVYERRVRILRRAQSKVLSVDALSYRYAYAQAVVARGDERVAELLAEWARLGGRLGQLWTAARRLGVSLDAYTSGKGPRPWEELVRPGYPPAALQAAYRAALRAVGEQG